MFFNSFRQLPPLHASSVPQSKSSSKDIQVLLQHVKISHSSAVAEVFTNSNFDLLNQRIQTDFECRDMQLQRDAMPGGETKPSFEEVRL